ncbi:MAG: hypothetical protein JSS65_08115 [Armatimonadetes bacterium]|nr:hypothetical protein [Armatimonadota bacterium]
MNGRLCSLAFVGTLLTSACLSLPVARQGDPEALAKARRAVQENPYASGDVYANFGYQLMQKEDWAGAIPVYQEAAKRGGSSPKFKAVCTYNLACAYARSGQKDKAMATLKEALRFGYRALGDLRTDDDLVSLRGEPEWEELAATKDVSKMSRDEAWRYNIWLLDREIRRLHYSPYTKRTPAETDNETKALLDGVPRMDDDQIGVAILKYMAGFGDGHTNARTPSLTSTVLPVNFYWYEEGIAVRAADSAHKHLLGQRLMSVNGKPVVDVAAMMAPYISRDNDMWIKLFVPFYLWHPHILHGMGLSASADSVRMTFRDAAGKDTTVDLKGTTRDQVGHLLANNLPASFVNISSLSSGPAPLSATHDGQRFWFEYLPDKKLLYCQINAILNDQKETLAQFAARLYAEFDSQHAEGLVFDVRNNGGGNNTLLLPLIQGMIARPALTKRGHLFFITGRLTFSACQNFLSRSERQLPITVVGEPSGSKPNFIGESVPVVLPYKGVTASVSDLFWEDGQSWDTRQWITPHLVAPPTLAAAMANRDPAMEALLAYWKTVQAGG